MKVVLTAEEMKACDKATIEQIGLPAMVLMERAALAVVEEILKREEAAGRILIIAGKGNNGGDGLAVGRLLTHYGKRVTFYLPMGASTEETTQQKRIVQNLGCPICDKWPEGEYDIIIDALLGIGVSGNSLKKEYLELVQRINASKETGTRIYAVDLPTGIHTDTGKVLGEAVRADVTVTFQYRKKAHLLYPGKAYCGKVVVKDVGIEPFFEASEASFTYTDADIEKLLPERNPAGHKGSFGRVFLYAGSEEISGAAILCARAVMASGAGMLKIYTAERNRELIQLALPEAMVTSEVTHAIDWADVVIAGPGIGKSRQAYDILNQILSISKKPMVLDADAINLLAESRELLERLEACEIQNGGQVVLTPHPMEFVRLTGKSMEQYQENREQLLRKTGKELHSVVVSKDAATMVAAGNEDAVYLNTTGNDGMATAGSGDVLTGIIGGLMAQGIEAFEAACKGVFLHGLAGDRASQKKGTHGMMASDIVECMREYMK